LEPFSVDEANISIEGDRLLLPARTAQSLSLVLHELATNAVKHGALSVAAGRLSISWRADQDAGDDPRVAFTWKETGGPPVSKPKRRGFGLTVLKSAASETGGTAELSFEPDGIRFAFEKSLVPTVDRPFQLRQDAKPARRSEGASASRCVLVVEDELLIGLQLAQDLEDEGYHVVGPAITIEQGIELVREGGIDCALIDLRLGETLSSPIANLLREKEIPFALTTGFDEQHPIDRVFEGAPRLKKPYDAIAVRDLIRSLSRAT
jgi:CheY-like chemotaxis protein